MKSLINFIKKIFQDDSEAFDFYHRVAAGIEGIGKVHSLNSEDWQYIKNTMV